MTYRLWAASLLKAWLHDLQRDGQRAARICRVALWRVRRVQAQDVGELAYDLATMAPCFVLAFALESQWPAALVALSFGLGVRSLLASNGHVKPWLT